MFAHLRFLPNAFSYTPGDLKSSVERDLEWLHEVSPYRSSPTYQNQFALVSQRVIENAQQLTNPELQAIMQASPPVHGVTNVLYK